MAMSKKNKQDLALKASSVFSPAAPIREKDVFAGRTDQIRTVLDAVNQTGQHALIYGERGVGKTSLANVLASFITSAGLAEVIAPHVNCDTSDNFSTLWRKVFQRIPVLHEHRSMGLKPAVQKEITRLADHLPESVTPETILSASLSLTKGCLFTPIIDEFDRLTNQDAARQFTDTIKALSDQSPATTLILVGVAENVEQLITEHQSIERALVQVRMPRMSRKELKQILATGATNLHMSVESAASEYIATLSQGLPHYTHLLGLHATRKAIDDGKTKVTAGHVDAAIQKAIDGAQQTLQRTYHQATISPRSDTRYAQVLLACALAATDQLGYFAAADVRAPMSRIMKRRYEIAAFSPHLADFCLDKRGSVLQRTGVPRRYRFRFRNPLLQPFVIMQGLAQQLISRNDLKQLAEQ